MTKILFFGPLRDAAGCSQLEVELPREIDCLDRLREWLSEGDPLLGQALFARSVRVAINHAFVPHNAPLGAPEEIAFMSPLSGG